jgi:CheY-like chemotaxis protein
MSSLRLLYVDDEPDIREIASLALGLDPQIEVRTEDSGSAALATAADWKPDAILLDVMMPKMDGPATLKCLRENADTCHIPVLFITARAQSGEIENLIALGAKDVITKPFDPMQLAALVRRKMAA